MRVADCREFGNAVFAGGCINLVKRRCEVFSFDPGVLSYHHFRRYSSFSRLCYDETIETRAKDAEKIRPLGEVAHDETDQ